MIKLMQIITDMNIGGAGIWLLNFLRHYDRSRLDVTVVLPRGSALAARVGALEVRYIEANDIGDRSFSPAGIKNIREIIERESPQVIHTHASLSARLAAKISHVPVVNTRHCLEMQKHGIKRAVYRRVNNFLSDRVIAVSRAVYKNLLEDGIPEEKLRLVYNGVEPVRIFSEGERERARLAFGTEGCVAVGIFARLESVKNHRLFLLAAQAVYEVNDRFRFFIVGGGSLEEELKREAARLGIADVVTFTGYVDDITELMNVIDINVLTSDFEAMSISLAEGMTAGKPCITTDAGGTREVVENGKSGLVIKPGDTVALASAILTLASEPGRMRTFGEYGKAVATEKFSPVLMCEKLTGIYTEIAKGGNSNDEEV